MFVVVAFVAVAAFASVVNDDALRSSVHAEYECGADGDNVMCVLDGNTMTVSGSGNMKTYGSRGNFPPWKLDGKDSYIYEINISNDVTSIGDNAFRDLLNLVSVSIPESVTYIREAAFLECSSLTSVSLPNSLTVLGGNVFNGCSSLTSIVIPYGVTSIPGYTFYACKSLQSVTIPDSVTSIEQHAFAYCEQLISVILPDSVKSVGLSVFLHCSSLRCLTIPDKVTLNELYALTDCDNLTVYYHGADDLCSEDVTYLSTNALKGVCLPPDYKPDAFCNSTLPDAFDRCRSFRSKSMQCSGTSRTSKGMNEREERGVTKCLEYICFDENEVVSWGKCTESEDGSRKCVNQECKADEETESDIESGAVSIVIDLDEGATIIDLSVTDILTKLSDECGIKPDEMTIEWESDDQGRLIRILIHMNDEDTARRIADSVSYYSKNQKECNLGILCRSVSVHISTQEEELSRVCGIHQSSALAITLFILWVVVVVS